MVEEGFDNEGLVILDSVRIGEDRFSPADRENLLHKSRADRAHSTKKKITSVLRLRKSACPSRSPRFTFSSPVRTMTGRLVEYFSMGHDMKRMNGPVPATALSRACSCAACSGHGSGTGLASLALRSRFPGLRCRAALFPGTATNLGSGIPGSNAPPQPRPRRGLNSLSVGPAIRPYNRGETSFNRLSWAHLRMDAKDLKRRGMTLARERGPASPLRHQSSFQIQPSEPSTIASWVVPR